MNFSDYRVIFYAFVALFFTVNVQSQNRLPDKEISYTFYGLGDYGEDNTSANGQKNIDALSTLLKSEGTNSTVFFLGNNATTNGFKKESVEATKNLMSQIEAVKGFKGRTIFIPGNLDWSSGLKGLSRQEKFIENALGKNTFLPENGCPIERIKINNEVDVLILDSQWALSNWDEYPTINEKCEIKTKEEFYVEVESSIKKSEGKTVLLVMHHPVQSLGKYGAQFSFGVNPQDLSNVHYKEFSDRIITIARQTNNVILLSGHDNNLQYFEEKGIPVIISGSGKSSSKVGSRDEGFFSEEVGFTKITQFTDGSVWLSFYGESNTYKQPIFNKEIRTETISYESHDYDEYNTPQYVQKSIYEPEELERSGFYKALWGAHYREDYATKINIKTALLDTLYGGLKPLRKGGGHQTNSIRLINNEGRQYAMRSAKKSALRFIQYFLFKTQYLESDVEETYFVQLLQDYWTTANPYGSLTIADLADAVGILHPNPALYYIPKQKILGPYNDDYGDKIYFIEERLSEGQEDVESLGKGDKIIGTLDLFEELRRKENVKIDERLYIRTRIFDNLVGDWDRHADQWKWAEKDLDNGMKLYQPIPRDRDQVYSDFDGFILGTLTALTPSLRFMQRYDSDYNHVKWYNDAGDDVDLTVLKNHTKQDWIEEARFIKENITEATITKAFGNLPSEIDQEKVTRVKKALLGRLSNIEENAIDMYEYLSRCVIVTGTDKDDYFEITRLPDGKTKIVGYRIKKGEKGDVFWNVTYDKTDTKEIWLYGLDDKDVFEVKGEGNKRIHLKIIGGNGNDTYRISNKKNVKVYDFKSKKNTFETNVNKLLSDNFDLNTYYFKKQRRDLSNTIPLVSFDPDNGFGVGVQYSYKKNSLARNPFTDNHRLGLIYYSETSGVDFNYSGEFAYIFDGVNLGIEAGFSSPNFTNNFFGIGNDTQNMDDVFDMDFNRVRMERLSIAPSLIFRGYQGSEISIGVSYEDIEIERTAGRFIATSNDVNPEVFEGQSFLGVEASYLYDNLKGSIISKSGVGFGATVGYKANLDEDRSFAYIIPEVRIATKLDQRGIFVIASKAKAHINLSDDFEFYQGAVLGDGDGLRGFRQQRFTGKRSVYHNTDLRISLGRIRNGIIPISVGAYGGFDYGRVWEDNDNSSTWHTSPGGGVYFSIGGFTALNLAFFSSDDGGRFTFGLSLPF